MESYGDFAYVYDTFMDETPYDEWCDFIEKTLSEYGIDDGLLLDLGCGTGVLTRKLRDRGYSMIGIDNSYDMLEVARDAEYDRDSYDIDAADEELETVSDEYFADDQEDSELENFADEEENSEALLDSEVINSEADSNLVGQFETDGEYSEDNDDAILYLLQDMREFELYGTVRAVVSVCDSINYLTDIKDVIRCFKLVNNYLDPSGIFIFDFNTVYKYAEVIGDRTIAENREDCSFIWENYYHEDTHINEYDLTIFAKEGEDELFRRSTETHYQRGYTLDEMIKCVKKSGLEFVSAFDADNHGEVSDTSERIYIVAKERMK